MVEKGAWNHAIIVLGRPGTGKSCYALSRALALGETPAYVIAFDPGWRLPQTLPDGRSANLKRYTSVVQASGAIARDASGVHVIDGSTSAEVVDFAARLGQASLARGQGERGTPVVLLLDEALSVPGTRCYRLGEDLAKLLAMRRHLHVAVITTAQSARLVHYELLGLSTEVVCFQMVDSRSHERLVSVGMDPETVNQIAGLPPYHSVTFHP